jgi:hypothetical protein
VQVGLHQHREQRLIHSPAALEQRREERRFIASESATPDHRPSRSESGRGGRCAVCCVLCSAERSCGVPWRVHAETHGVATSTSSGTPKGPGLTQLPGTKPWPPRAASQWSVRRAGARTRSRVAERDVASALGRACRCAGRTGRQQNGAPPASVIAIEPRSGQHGARTGECHCGCRSRDRARDRCGHAEVDAKAVLGAL